MPAGTSLIRDRMLAAKRGTANINIAGDAKDLLRSPGSHEGAKKIQSINEITVKVDMKSL